MHISVFGASFDPPTGSHGHTGIVAFFAQRVDLVLVLPVYVHPFGEKKRIKASFEDRMEMCRLAFGSLSDHKNVVVTECEKVVAEDWIRSGSTAIPGTMDVLEWIETNLYPKARISFILGTDTYNDLIAGRWKRNEELLRRFRFYVVMRRAFFLGGGLFLLVAYCCWSMRMSLHLHACWILHVLVRINAGVALQQKK